MKTFTREILLAGNACQFPIDGECGAVEQSASIENGQPEGDGDAFGLRQQFMENGHCHLRNTGRVKCVFATVTGDGQFRQTQQLNALLFRRLDDGAMILGALIPGERRLIENGSSDFDELHVAIRIDRGSKELQMIGKVAVGW